MEKLTEAQVAYIKGAFHDALQGLRYDLGGSLADLVEDALASTLSRVNNDGPNETKPQPVPQQNRIKELKERMGGYGKTDSAGREEPPAVKPARR